nr:hypothetical protein CFP56_50917 [Quercus suber]
MEAADAGSAFLQFSKSTWYYSGDVEGRRVTRQGMEEVRDKKWRELVGWVVTASLCPDFAGEIFVESGDVEGRRVTRQGMEEVRGKKWRELVGWVVTASLCPDFAGEIFVERPRGDGGHAQWCRNGESFSSVMVAQEKPLSCWDVAGWYMYIYRRRDLTYNNDLRQGLGYRLGCLGIISNLTWRSSGEAEYSPYEGVECRVCCIVWQASSADAGILDLDRQQVIFSMLPDCRDHLDHQQQNKSARSNALRKMRLLSPGRIARGDDQRCTTAIRRKVLGVVSEKLAPGPDYWKRAFQSEEGGSMRFRLGKGSLRDFENIRQEGVEHVSKKTRQTQSDGGTSPIRLRSIGQTTFSWHVCLLQSPRPEARTIIEATFVLGRGSERSPHQQKYAQESRAIQAPSHVDLVKPALQQLING